jgi:hypothetical protein
MASIHEQSSQGKCVPEPAGQTTIGELLAQKYKEEVLRKPHDIRALHIEENLAMGTDDNLHDHVVQEAALGKQSHVSINKRTPDM